MLLTQDVNIWLGIISLQVLFLIINILMSVWKKEYLQNDMHGFLISLNSKYGMFSYTLHGEHTYINTKNVLMGRVYEHICEG